MKEAIQLIQDQELTTNCKNKIRPIIITKKYKV